MWPNTQFLSGFVTITEEILNGKFLFFAVLDICGTPGYVSAPVWVEYENARIFSLELY